MAIVDSKLVSAAMLQDFIIGKDALPLAAGIITMYQDSNHSLLKNWYYQTGVAGAYTYAALPNPMVLSAAGTMQDVNGNDIIPFYYPWNELDADISDPYFVTVYNSNGQLQFTRSGFPFVSEEAPSPGLPNFVTQQNYVINNRFWRNVGSLTPTNSNNGTWTTQYNSTGSVAFWTLAPDQHDGFSMPDFNYIVPTSDLGNTTETITFATFSPALSPAIVSDIQPEYYIHHVTTADSGTYTKIYQFPISLHTATLANQPFTVTIQTKGSIVLTLSVYTFAGTGVASPIAQEIGHFTMSSANWTKNSFNGTFLSNLGLPSTTTKDDAYYLQISFASGAADFNFTLPSIYLYENSTAIINGNELFNFSTYDQIDSVIASPRTGDIKTSLNTFYPFGWVPLNDGTISSPGSVTPPSNGILTYQGYDGWPLYNLLWNTFSPYVINGAEVLPIYNSAGTLTSFGASAQADWNALKQIQLTLVMGRVLLGTVPVSAMTLRYTTTVTASNGSPALVFTAANSFNLFNGMPVYFTNTGGALPTGISANTIYYAGGISGNAFNVSVNFGSAMAGTFIAYTNAGSGTTKAIMAFAGTSEGEYAHTQLLNEMINHTHDPLSGSTGFWTATAAGNITFPNAGTAVRADATTGNVTGHGAQTGFNVTQPGTFFNMFMKL